MRIRAACAWASLMALSGSLLGVTGSEYVGFTLMDVGQACYRHDLIPIEDSDTCFGEAALFLGLNPTSPGYVSPFNLGPAGCVFHGGSPGVEESEGGLVFYPASLGGDEEYEGGDRYLCIGMVTTTSMTSESSTTPFTTTGTSTSTSAITSTTSTTTSTTSITSTSATTFTSTYKEATLTGTVTFEATGGSARRLGGASLDAEVVGEAARAALASVLEVGEEAISVSSSSTGNVWRVEYAAVGTLPEMLVALDVTQGMADGNGDLEAALDSALGSLSAQLALGSVFADRGEVLIGNYPLTNTLTSTATSTSYQPAGALDGEASQEAASTIVIVIALVLMAIGAITLVVCRHYFRREKRQREKKMNGFDSISPTSAWGCDDGGTATGAPPLEEGHHKDVQPGQLPEFHLRW